MAGDPRSGSGGMQYGSLMQLRWVALALWLSVASGCQSKSNAGAGAGSGAAEEGSVLTLPRPSGKPPAKTTQRITNFTSLAALELGGFKKDVQATSPGLLVRHTTRERPRLAVKVSISACDGTCPGAPTREQIVADIRPPLRDAADLAVEVGTTQVEGGAVAATVYKLGYASGDHNGPVTQYVHSYALYYNDGVNQLEVTTLYADDNLGSKAALLDAAPRAQLERIGKAAFDLYAQAWAN